MAPKQKKKVQEKQLKGFKYFKPLSSLLERLHNANCQRDKAGNRILHMDQYMSLLLLGMFNPLCDSLRAIQQASELKKVQKKLGVPRSSLGSLSDAARVFDSELLKELISELIEEIRPPKPSAGLKDLDAIITLVDGTLLTELPRTVKALWLNEKTNAFKAHVHYELVKGIPVKSTLTDANASECAVLSQELEAGRLYVLDRGYGKYELMQDIIDAKSSFICRIPLYYNADVQHENEISEPARKAGVIKDHIAIMGSVNTKENLKGPLRIIELTEVESTYKSMRMSRNRGTKDETMRLITNRTDLPAETIALIYQYRWQIEIFFRWFKHILGCRHLLSHCENGIELQIYAAILACLIISYYTGGKASKRTFEMFCWYLAGVADEEELMTHINKLQPAK